MNEPLPTRVAATVTGNSPTGDSPTGWRALTDDGSELDLPRTAATRLRRLQPGQRVTVELVDGEVVRVSIG
ncbi:hypothetical protein ACSDQ9_00325 [Aestuariimicrobium soli]|uniref:hypothetical protein n=1 Tax=Aestuariimicrobium soli TaxID=2035834 RepID=UPI003EB70B3E